MDTLTFTVTGMTCQHCTASVREEISDVAGVSGVEVDLATGTATVTGTSLSATDITTAITEAGYSVLA